MSYNNGPKSVTSGLVLVLDAGNSRVILDLVPRGRILAEIQTQQHWLELQHIQPTAGAE